MNKPAVVQTESVRAELRAAYDRFEGFDRKRLEQAQTIGAMLAEQKRKAGHGHWEKWVKENCPFGTQRAGDFIRVYLHRDELKSRQMAGFEEALQYLRVARTQAGQPTSDDLAARLAEFDGACRRLEERDAARLQEARLVGAAMIELEALTGAEFEAHLPDTGVPPAAARACMRLAREYDALAAAHKTPFAVMEAVGLDGENAIAH